VDAQPTTVSAKNLNLHCILICTAFVHSLHAYLYHMHGRQQHKLTMSIASFTGKFKIQVIGIRSHLIAGLDADVSVDGTTG
jgi:hypothetical protein